MAPLKFVLQGPPRTKKNHQRIIRVKGRPVIVQADSANAWEEMAILQLRSQWNLQAGLCAARGPLTESVNLRALVYRECAGRADLLNYLAAVSDALEGAQVVANDCQVRGLDGSRLFVDRVNPRVEITLTPLAEEA